MKSLPSPRRALATALLSALLAAPSAARAQQAPALRLTQPVPDPGKSIASADDLAAISLNPANLAWLPEWELRGTFAWTTNDSPRPMRGFSASAGLPFWLLATGLRFDLLTPPPAAGAPFDAPSGWIRWGLAIREGDTLAFGTTLAWSVSDSPFQNGIFTLTSGLTFRPTSYLSLAAVARDWNGGASSNGEAASRVFELGATARPLATRALEIGLEGQYHQHPTSGEVWGVRSTLAVDVPRVGRLRGEITVLDPSAAFAAQRAPLWMGMAGVEVNLGTLQASSGAIFGDAIAGNGVGAGLYVGAAWRGYKEPGIPPASRVARLRIDGTPGARGHVRLLRRLWRLATDAEVDGVLVVVRGAEPAGSLAHAEEVGDAFRLLRANGKKVICALEDAGGRSLYACSQADKIIMSPAGGLRFAGLSSGYFYFGGLLKKLGVRAEFVRIGAHKLAAEQFTLAESSDVGKSDHQELVNELERTFVHDVGGGRKIAASDLKARIAKGPFVAKEARQAGLVDVLAFDDELGRAVEEIMGRRVRLLDVDATPKAPARWQPASYVCVVYLHGDMVDGESQYIPFLGVRLAGSRTIVRALRSCRDDSDAKAVVFRIETGGGSSLAADVILREALLTAKKKPLVVSMGSAAASGGYYAAMAGKSIFANRATITGSIGIFYGKVDFAKLLGSVGVGVENYRSAPRADAESLYRPFTDDERRELGVKVKQFYDTFIGRVVDGRGMTAAEVDAVARGKVWTGEQALVRKLVDKVGGFRQALAEARRLGGLPDDSPIAELPAQDDSLLGFLLAELGIRFKLDSSALALPLPPAMLDLARALAPFWLVEDGHPLARAELGELGVDLEDKKSPDEDPAAARKLERELDARTKRGLIR